MSKSPKRIVRIRRPGGLDSKGPGVEGEGEVERAGVIAKDWRDRAMERRGREEGPATGVSGMATSLGSAGVSFSCKKTL